VFPGAGFCLFWLALLTQRMDANVLLMWISELDAADGQACRQAG